MPNLTTHYSKITFEFWNDNPAFGKDNYFSVNNDYISDFCLHDVHQDWRWFQWNDYIIRFACEGCYFVFCPVVYNDDTEHYDIQTRATLKREMTEFFERLRTPDLWTIIIDDDDGSRHRVALPFLVDENQSRLSPRNVLQTTHFAENGWAYVIIGSKEYTEQCVQRLAWVNDARADGQPTIVECKEKAQRGVQP